MPANTDQREVDTARVTPVGYSYAHKKVSRARGKATDYTCEDAHPGQPHQAAQWAYVPGDTHEQTGLRTTTKNGVTSTYVIAWSANVWAYVPLCGPCHALRDREVRNG